jgi:ribosome-binding protein aMBF1 (putative translation factor)
MITGAQIVAARKLLGWEPDRLAKKAKLPVTVIRRAELSLGDPVITITQLDTLLRTLKTAGIVFTSEEPGVKLAKEGLL